MSTEVLRSIVALGITETIIVILLCFSLYRKPQWINDGPLKDQWKKINVVSAILATVFMLGVFFLYREYIVDLRFLIASSTGILTFVLGQTAFTDSFQRLADRHLLRISNVFSGIIGSWFLYNYVDHTMLLMYVLFFIGAFIFIFIPGLGASDSRALQLVVLSTFPILLVSGFQWGLIAFLIVILLYGAIYSIVKKSFKGFFTKISLPMVPLIIAPFLIVSIIYNVIV